MKKPSQALRRMDAQLEQLESVVSEDLADMLGEARQQIVDVAEDLKKAGL